MTTMIILILIEKVFDREHRRSTRKKKFGVLAELIKVKMSAQVDWGQVTGSACVQT